LPGSARWRRAAAARTHGDQVVFRLHHVAMLLVSRNGSFHEMEQLREFAHFAHEADVSRFVHSAFYDSDIDLCRFSFADHDGLDDASRDRIFDAAQKTITRFEFDGRIYHGGIPPESDG